MDRQEFSYAIIQYSSHPERYEYLNVGVVVFGDRATKLETRLANNFSRVKRVFKDASPSFLKLALVDYSSRISFEYKDASGFDELSSKLSRASSSFRLTPFSQVLAKNPKNAVDRLFGELVEARPVARRDRRIDWKLKEAFKEQGVLQFLDRKPEPVWIEKYKIDVKAKYGFQNGSYNLIDAARFDDTEKALEEAGKRFFEGKALAETLGHRLVVVGDFGDQSQSFFRTIRDDLSRANTKLYRIGELDELSDTIRTNLASH